MERPRVIAIALFVWVPLLALALVYLAWPENTADKDPAGEEANAAPNRSPPAPPGQSEHGEAARAGASSGAFTEQALLEAAQKASARAPRTALELIGQADRLYGEHDESRRALEIEVQVQLGHIGHARSLADRFFRTFPHSPRIARIERLTGYHPRPYGPNQ